MGIASWIMLGLVAGFLAWRFTPGRNSGPLGILLLLGALGAAAGGASSVLLGGGAMNAFDFRNLGTAISGSVYILACYVLVARPAPTLRRPPTDVGERAAEKRVR